MAVYNGERHLPEALDTLLAQTLSDFELVVVDDASTDRTAEILADYARQDGRLTVLRNEVNRRLPASLNRGLERCRASLVARADADDVYLPERLERQVAFLDQNPDVGVVGCAYHRIHEDGRRKDTKRPPRDHATIRARELFMSSLLHPGVVFRTHVVRSVGGYDEAYWTAQDSDLWARLRDRTRLTNLPDVLVEYRVHSGSVVGTRGDAGKRLSLSVPQRLLSETLGRPLDEDDVRAVVTLYQGFEAMEAPDVRRGLPLLWEVVGHLDRDEPRAARRWLRREAAASLLKQAEDHPRDRPLVRTLLTAAVRMNPRLVFSSHVRRRVVHAVLSPA